MMIIKVVEITILILVISIMIIIVVIVIVVKGIKQDQSQNDLNLKATASTHRTSEPASGAVLEAPHDRPSAHAPQSLSGECWWGRGKLLIVKWFR